MKTALPPLDRCCDLCGGQQEEVIGYMEKAEEHYPVRAGWICWECWPKEGAWHKAILRERTVIKHTEHTARKP